MVKLVVRPMQALVALAVAGSLFMSAVIIISAIISALNSTRHAISEEQMNIEVLRGLSVEALEVADSFLLGLVLFIIGVGMLQLFFKFDNRDEIPGWMRVDSLTDMKEDIIAVTLVMLGISFLSRVVEYESGKDILYLGAGVGIVLIPLVALYVILDVFAGRESQEFEEMRDANDTVPASKRTAPTAAE